MFIDVSPYALNKNSLTEESADGEGFIELIAYHTMDCPIPEDADVKSWVGVERHNHEENEEGEELHEGTDFTIDIGGNTESS